MFQFIKAAVGEIVSRVSDGEPLKNRNESPDIREEEVLFCKNNVCVHVPRSSKNKTDLRPNQDDHIPGYFSLKRIAIAGIIPELVLTWVPNMLLTVSNIDDSVQDGLEITTCSEVDTSCMSANELSCIEEDENGSDKNEKRLKENVSESELQANKSKIDKSETNSPVYLECGSQHSSTSTSPRHESSETFSTPYGGIFSINLIDMKALKLFLSSKEGTNGQLVISSLENQYKVFHFHHSGIDKLSGIFSDWEGCQEERDEDFVETLQKVYFVSKNLKAGMKTETGADMHPEDGNYLPLNMTAWRGFINSMGQIEDVNNFRKHVFFAGLNQEVRQDAWKFLLYCYPVQSTSFERDRMRKEKEDDFKSIHNRRLALTGEEYEKFWKDIQFTVDKDVVRTDRSHPFFAGQDNPNVEKMRNILLNYAIHNRDMGYTQGMSDLLSPLLSTIQDEVDTFWCFVGLMEFSLFATTPTDQSMDKSLGYLRELLRVMYPDFYIHYLMQDEDLDLLFCHRWLVLCFKREFIEPEVLSLWEACWSRYQTDYFHIFICVAMIRLYGNRCIAAKMRVDEMMQYFMDMAMQFDGSAVLREARSLLYRFRKFQVIPCTLEGFLSGPGVWDGGIEPEIECVSRHRRCCFVEQSESEVNAAKSKRSDEILIVESSKNAEDCSRNNESIEVVKKLDEATNISDNAAAEKSDSTAVKSDASSEMSDTVTEKSGAAAEKSHSTAAKLDASPEMSDTVAEQSGAATEKSDSPAVKSDASSDMSDTVTEQSGAAAEKSDSTAVKPDASSEMPDTAIEKSGAAAEKSDSPAVKSDSSSDMSDTVTEQSGAAAEKSDTTAVKSDASSDMSDTVTEKSGAAAEKSDSTAVKSDASSEMSDTAPEKSFTEKSETAGEKSGTTTEEQIDDQCNTFPIDAEN